MKTSHVSVIHFDTIPSETFTDFSNLIQNDGLDYKCESTPNPGAYACIEWLLPTFVIVFIGKSYFDGFLKEAGKDHYQLLKKGLITLSDRFVGTNAPSTRLVFTPGKAIGDQPKYSLVYSVYAELGDGFSAKLLLQNDFSAQDCNAAQSCFLDFIQGIHQDHINLSFLTSLANTRLVGKTLFLAYNPELRQLEVVDPLPAK